MRYRELGQLVIGSLPGKTVTPEIASVAKQFDLGGVTLFDRNIEEPKQVAELSREVQTLAGELPLWIAVDQEGGRVARLRSPFTEWPPMAVLGRSGDVGLAARFASALALELRAVGVSLDFAPVLDVHTNPRNPVIGDRALAADADLVASLGAAIVRALQDEGIAACGKHFPGHGDTMVDSHLDLPIVEHPPDRIRRVECVPFRAAIAADVACIMTAHVLIPALDANQPATLSSTIIDGLLRTELGFGGVIVSDDLEMRAVAERVAVPDAAVQAVAAGCDAVLVCSGDEQVQMATVEALVHAVEDGRIPRRRIDDALGRLRRTKARFLGRASARAADPASVRTILGCDAHRRIAEEMAAYL